MNTFGEELIQSMKEALAHAKGDCINTHCPWSGKPVQADSLTEYRGNVVGFCNTGCRDKFERAVSRFEELLAAKEKAPGA